MTNEPRLPKWGHIDFEADGSPRSWSTYGPDSADEAIEGIKKFVALAADQTAGTATFDMRPAGSFRNAEPSARLDIGGCARDGRLTPEQETTIRRRLKGAVAPWLVLSVAFVDGQPES